MDGTVLEIVTRTNGIIWRGGGTAWRGAIICRRLDTRLHRAIGTGQVIVLADRADCHSSGRGGGAELEHSHCRNHLRRGPGWHTGLPRITGGPYTPIAIANMTATQTHNGTDLASQSTLCRVAI